MCNAARFVLHAIRWLVAGVLLCGAPSFASSIERAAARLPEPPAPPRTTLEWIAHSMRMNGLPMTLRSFRSTLSPDDVLVHYARWWSSADAGSRGTAQTFRQGDWNALALTSPRILITVRARQESSGSSGTIAVSPNPSLVKVSTATSFPYPTDAHVTNLQQYDDAGTRAEHISFSTTRSIAIATRQFSQTLTRSGWNVYRDQPSQSFEAGHVLEAQRGGDLAQLTFTPAARSGSDVVVIWRKG